MALHMTSSHIYNVTGMPRDFLRFIDSARQSPYFNSDCVGCQHADRKRMAVFFDAADMLDHHDEHFSKDARALADFVTIARENGEDISRDTHLIIDMGGFAVTSPDGAVRLQHNLTHTNRYVS